MTDKLIPMLDEIKARHEAATEALAKACKRQWAGEPALQWKIPADPKTDTDLIIGSGLADTPKMERRLRAMQRVIEALQEFRGFYGASCGTTLDQQCEEAESALAELIKREWT